MQAKAEQPNEWQSNPFKGTWKPNGECRNSQSWIHFRTKKAAEGDEIRGRKLAATLALTFALSGFYSFPFPQATYLFFLFLIPTI